MADDQFPDTLNPLQAGLKVDERIIDMMWAPLIRWDAQSRAFGDLALDVPTAENHQAVISGGRLAVTIDLRPGLRWSDGSPITSADILFGWQVGMDAATGPFCTGSCDAIANIDTPNSHTAVLHFSAVHGAYLGLLPPVLPAHAFQSVHQAASALGGDTSYNYENSGYVTSGPYQVSVFVPNDRIEPTPNKYYTATVGPYLSKIVFMYYGSAAGMEAAAASGAVDESEDYQTSDLSTLSATAANTSASVSIMPSTYDEQLVYNSASGATADVKVRRALSMAVDRVGLCASVLGSSTACERLQQEGPISPVAAIHVSPQGLGYDLAAARSLLASSGYGGQTIDLVTTDNPVRRAEAAVLQTNWQAIGAAVSVSTVSAARLFGSWSQGGILQHGNFQVALFGYGVGYFPDELAYSYGSTYIPSATNTSLINENVGRVTDPSIDADFSSAAATIDPLARQKLFQDFAQRVVSQAYMLPLYSVPTIATHNPTFGYFDPNSDGTSWNSPEWYSTAAMSIPPPAMDTSSSGTVTQPTPAPTSVTATPVPTATHRPRSTKTSKPGRRRSSAWVSFHHLGVIDVHGVTRHSFHRGDVLYTRNVYRGHHLHGIGTLTLVQSYQYWNAVGRQWIPGLHPLPPQSEPVSNGVHAASLMYQVPHSLSTAFTAIRITVTLRFHRHPQSRTVTIWIRR